MMAALTGLLALVAILAGAWVPRPSRVPPVTRPGRTGASQVARRVERARSRLLRRRHRAQRDAQLPDLLERIASGLRAGLALSPAVIAAADGIPPPLRVELAPLAAAVRHGVPLAGELDRWAAAEGASAEVRLVTTSLALSRQTGGPTALAVDRVAATLRERRELQAEAHALATQARASATLLAVAPLLFAVLVTTIEPGAAAVLVTTPIGAGCLLVGLGLEALGAVWMARIVRSPC